MPPNNLNRLIERNLKAISRTPKVHREELLRFVHRPELIRLIYPPVGDEIFSCQALGALRHLYANLDIHEDPYVISLKNDPSTRSSNRLRDALRSRKTYCQQLMEKFYGKAESIYRELGTRAVEYFIRSCKEKVMAEDVGADLAVTEKLYIKKLLAHLHVPAIAEESVQDGPHLSPKVRCLVNFLEDTYDADFTGLIFVQTRASVAVLAHLLSIHVSTRNNYKISTFVGTSSVVGRKFNIGELLDVKFQKHTLDDLRHGRKNLVITTSALEEGIDVSACNHIICFEKPPNFKSFIQRRGRARKKASTFTMMFEEGDDVALMSTWQELEAEMMKTYMDDMRHIQEIEAMEGQEDACKEFVVESTGYFDSSDCNRAYLRRASAKLTLDDAVAHLNHFCATLPTSRYTDLRPIFTFSGGPPDGKRKDISAKVLLPNTVDVSVREACSGSQWVTERLAKQDAAFEAYIALFEAGLVNEHLLPLRYDEEITEASSAIDKRPSLVQVPAQMSFWSDLIAPKWQTMPELYKSHITIYREELVMMQILMILPMPLPKNIFSKDTYYELGWNRGISLTAKVDATLSEVYSPQRLSNYARATELLLGSVYRNRFGDQKNDFVCLFGPAQIEDLQEWLETNSGATPAHALSFDNINALQIGLIRNLSERGVAYIFDGIESDPAESQASRYTPAVRSDGQHTQEERYLRAVRLSKKADFMRSLYLQADLLDAHADILPVSRCEIENIPFFLSRFGLLVPSIMHQLDVQAVAESLCISILPTLEIEDVRLIITATSAPAAQEQDNYQRLEFIGDSLLKFFTSLTLMAQHLNWHEGVLTGRKDHVVSNGNLSLSACRVGLPKYIRSTKVAYKKWRPPCISDFSQGKSEETREMSTKTLADVVEALIGAAHLDGGEPKTLACLAVFLPEISWAPLSQHHQKLFSSYELDIKFPPNFVHVEQLIDHTFQHKTLLVEALTHPSHQGPNSSASYQRLEFLGDSILDNIVVRGAYDHKPPVPTPSLHLIRTALVNGSFLAFLCLSLSASHARTEIVSEPGDPVVMSQTTISQHLWEYMRHTNSAVRVSQQACFARYKLLQSSINEAILQGKEYPWVLLAQLDPPKYFSDIIESLLGAIYIDTIGSLAACEAFLDRLGIMTYLRRIISEDFALLHPKEKLGQLADTETVRYTRRRERKGEGDVVDEGAGEEGVDTELENEPGKLTCVVTVGDREIVQVRNGINALEVETRAAAEAVQILEREGRKLPKRM